MSQQLKKILFVEDEADIRTIAITVLESLGGFTVLPCESGQKALELAPSANADLILLDVMMPGMDGPSTLQALRKLPQTQRTPVIFMTAKVQTAEIAHFKSLGALDVIPKPFDPMTLAQQVLDIWNRAPRESAPANAKAEAERATREGLQRLLEDYAASLPTILGDIESMCRRMVAGEAEALRGLHRALHSLAGSAGTFGYATLGKNARALELSLAPHVSEGRLPPEKRDSLASAIQALKDASKAPDHPL